MMITFSIFFESAIYFRLESITLLFIVVPSATHRKSPDGQLEVRFGVATALDRQALCLPTVNRFTQLEEGEYADRDRHPEGDQAEDQDRGEDRGLGNPEEDEGADHAGVDRPDPRWRQREEVGDHAEEEALDDHRQRHVEAEGVEGGPEHADARRPEAGRAEHCQAAPRGVGEEPEREAEALPPRPRARGGPLGGGRGPPRRGKGAPAAAPGPAGSARPRPRSRSAGRRRRRERPSARPSPCPPAPPSAAGPRRRSAPAGRRRSGG